MKSLLNLAVDFLERGSNPSHGFSVNEEYTLRLAALMATEGFEGAFNREITLLDDASTFSAHGWFWILNWARAENVVLNSRLLLDLTKTASSVFLQASAIELAAKNAKTEVSNEIVSIQRFESDFFRDLLGWCTFVELLAEAESERKETPVSTRNAENILMALMHVDKPMTMAAARSLVHHPWRGQSKLMEFFMERCNGLEADTLALWTESLQVQPW